MFRTHYDKKARLWSGIGIPNLYNSKISLAQVILKACKTHGPKVAQISAESGKQLTYDELRTKIIRAAQNLQKRGYNSQEVFGVLARNSIELAPIIFASMAIGCPVNTLDPSFGKAELIHMLKTIKPALMFCDIETHDLVKECLIELGNNAKIFTFGGSKNGSEQVSNLFLETYNESYFLPVKVDGENETAAIVCSSGTTGLSKGVCLSHAALFNTISEFDVISSSDVLLCFSSLYWLSGWYVLLLGMLNGATRIITTKPFNAELQLQLIENYKVTFAWNAPHQAISITKHDRFNQSDLSSIKFNVITGGKTPFHIQNEINSKLLNGKAHNCYGISETAGVVSCNMGGKDSVGNVMSCHNIKIIDENGKRLGIGEDGEICIKSNYKFLGYYGNKNASDEALDKEGFFLSSDIGHFDENGDLFIVDRKKDIMKYCNFQVSPSEIECFLIKSPDIKVACVIGIPDEIAIELPAAFIIRDKHSNITKEDVYNLVAEHFADYCKLRGGVYFVDSLPMTPSGKLLRRKVRELAITYKQ